MKSEIFSQMRKLSATLTDWTLFHWARIWRLENQASMRSDLEAHSQWGRREKRRLQLEQQPSRRAYLRKAL